MVYTDGSGKFTRYSRHLRAAGFGVFWGPDDPRNLSVALTGPWQSAQRAEVSAVLAAARTPTEHPLLVSTDSQYTWAGACLLGAGFQAN